MTIELTYRDLGNTAFISGLRKLAQSDKWKEPKAAYNVAKLVDLLDQELKTFHELRKKFARRLADTKDKEKLDELQEEADKFAAISFVIDRAKVSFDDLAGIPLTPSEILSLTPILDNLPD